MLWRYGPATAFLISRVVVEVGTCGERPREVSYEFTYAAHVADLPESATNVDLWIPVPSDSQGQRVNGVRIVRPSGGQVRTEPQYQNRIFHYRFRGPFSKAQSLPAAELVFDVVRSEVVIPEAKALRVNGHVGKSNALDVYLRPNRLIPIGGKVSQIAASLKLPQHDPLRVGRRLYDYLIDTMVYDWKAPGAGRGDVLWACDSKRGDCTDYHSTLLRYAVRKGFPQITSSVFPFEPKRKPARSPITTAGHVSGWMESDGFRSI